MFRGNRQGTSHGRRPGLGKEARVNTPAGRGSRHREGRAPRRPEAAHGHDGRTRRGQHPLDGPQLVATEEGAVQIFALDQEYLEPEPLGNAVVRFEGRRESPQDEAGSEARREGGKGKCHADQRTASTTSRTGESLAVNSARLQPPAPSANPEDQRPHMKPATDYIRHAAKLARKLQMDAAMGGKLEPDGEFFKALSKALEEIAAGLEPVSVRE